MTDEIKDDWITNAAGNKASISYFGSEDAARKALDSLENCQNCTNCSRCSGCSGCSRCSGCSDCSRCSGCSDCSRCSGCSDCSRCSRCSGCSGCSHVTFLYDKKDLRGDPSVTNEPGVPPIPCIDDIHRVIYAAVTAPNNHLEMGNWHKCETTHCRAGWVVTLAGEAGAALERFHNTELAAMLIYRESGYRINPGRFYDSNEAAMDDMRRLAQETPV